jgi:hypothetical protein
LALQACGEDKKKAEAATVEAPAKNDSKAPEVVNQVLVEAKQKGVNEACMKRVNNMSTFLIGGSQYSSMTYAAPKDAGENLFSAAIGHKGQDGTYLGLMDVSPTDNCSASYEIIKVWANNCQQVATSTFPQYKLKGQMASGTWVFELDANKHIFAMPSPGQGCVTIEKNMVFEPAK